MPYAAQASFNASGKDGDDPECLPGTRIDVLKRIREWIHEDDDKHLFWLSGLAGTGKSTIARTMAREIYASKKYWMASFFFKRGGGDTGHARQFVGTIATQLANKNTSFRELLQNAVSTDQGIVECVMRDQWNELIVELLSSLRDESLQSPLIIVVDALNECDREDDVIQILHLLAASRKLGRVRFRILITSTPEKYIQEKMSELTGAARPDIALHDVPDYIVNHDIFLFLVQNLANFRFPEEELRRLVQKAAGLFIWADTACRFITNGELFGKRRLHDILEHISSGTSPEEHLNKLYLTVLKNAISPSYRDDEKPELYSLVRHVLGSIVVLLAPLSSHSLGRLLGDPDDGSDIHMKLKHFYSILDVSKDKARPLRLHHPSFRDFLLNQKRCPDRNFWVNEQEMHQAMVKHCIDLMSNSLQEDICGAKSPGVRVNDIDEGHLQQCLPPELRYSCLYWVHHLQKSSSKVEDDDGVCFFLKAHLLHWLEALSLIGKASESFYIIRTVRSLLNVGDLFREA